MPKFVPVVWAVIAHGLGHRCPKRENSMPTVWAILRDAHAENPYAVNV